MLYSHAIIIHAVLSVHGIQGFLSCHAGRRRLQCLPLSRPRAAPPCAHMSPPPPQHTPSRAHRAPQYGCEGVEVRGTRGRGRRWGGARRGAVRALGSPWAAFVATDPWRPGASAGAGYPGAQRSLPPPTDKSECPAQAHKSYYFSLSVDVLNILVWGRGHAGNVGWRVGTCRGPCLPPLARPQVSAGEVVG